jgi:hypothetical protein
MSRPLIAILATCILVAAACGNDNGNGDDTTTTTADDERAWVECVNEEEGFTVEHPADWTSNDGTAMAECSLFDPEPLAVEPATDIPLDIAISITVDPVPVDDALDALGIEELDRDERTVDGLDAVRQEVRSDGAGQFPEGMLTTRWLIDVGDGRTLFAQTHDVGEPPYDETVQVLDEMVERMTFRDDPDEGTTTTTTAPPEEGPDMVGEPTLETIQSEDFPGGFADIVHLVDVRTAAHDGFDRVVLEFDGDSVPSYRIGYVEPPIRQPGSGHVLEVEGSAFLELRLQPARGVDLSGEEVRETYGGPDRIPLDPGTPTRELVFEGDFEANMAWVVGADRRLPFAMTFLEDPLRLVVDMAHN